jgi:hypothetical protein
MSIRKLFILSVVLLISIFIVWGVELPRSKAKKNKGLLLGGATKSDIQSITIDLPESSPYTLRRSSSNDKSSSSKTTKFDDLDYFNLWEVVKNEEVIDKKLEAATLSSLFAQLLETNIGEPLPAAELDADLSTYGLKEPALSLVVNIREKKPISILMGKRASFSGERYIQVDGREIFLISEGLFFAAQKDMNLFRTKNRIAFDNESVQYISVAPARGAAIELVKKGDVWNVTSNEAFDKSNGAQPAKPQLANKDKVAELLRRLRALQASGFIDRPGDLPKSINLGEPDARIVLKKDQNTAIDGTSDISLYVPSEDPASMVLSIGDTPPFFKISGNTINNFALTYESIIDRTIISFVPKDVTSVSVNRSSKGTNDAQLYNLVRSDSSWKVDGEAGDALFIEEYLRKLASLEFVEIIPDIFEFPKETDSQVVIKLKTGQQILLGVVKIISKDHQAQTEKYSTKLFVKKNNPDQKSDINDLKGYIVTDEVSRKIVANKEALLPVKKEN